MGVNKVTWQQVGHVTSPGRYMFRFGWLTVTAEDLAVWDQFPDAAFALVKTAAADGRQGNAGAPQKEFHLGAFELRENPRAR